MATASLSAGRRGHRSQRLREQGQQRIVAGLLHITRARSVSVFYVGIGIGIFSTAITIRHVLKNRDVIFPSLLVPYHAGFPNGQQRMFC